MTLSGDETEFPVHHPAFKWKWRAKRFARFLDQNKTYSFTEFYVWDRKTNTEVF